jgi:hypothetical protein
MSVLFDLAGAAGGGDVLMRFGLREDRYSVVHEAPAPALRNLESFWILVRHRATSALCHKRTSVPDVSRCWGVDHAEHRLEMANGGYCRALLYLLDHPIPAQLAESLNSWKRSLWVIFSITNLLFISGQQLPHTLSNQVRVFPLIAQNVLQEGFDAFVHRRLLSILVTAGNSH